MLSQSEAIQRSNRPMWQATLCLEAAEGVLTNHLGVLPAWHSKSATPPGVLCGHSAFAPERGVFKLLGV
jgi:hypothetical protein